MYNIKKLFTYHSLQIILSLFKGLADLVKTHFPDSKAATTVDTVAGHLTDINAEIEPIVTAMQITAPALPAVVLEPVVYENITLIPDPYRKGDIEQYGIEDACGLIINAGSLEELKAHIDSMQKATE